MEEEFAAPVFFVDDFDAGGVAGPDFVFDNFDVGIAPFSGSFPGSGGFE